MSGPKQKRPYKRRETSNAYVRIIHEPIVSQDITAETVYLVEAAIGRTATAWGMVDPLELIRAVDRVLRGVRDE